MATVDYSQILGSWKEIAAYLGKGVRTVQRWELLHGLPVRRPKGAPRGVVHATRAELDQWLATQWSQREMGHEFPGHFEVHMGSTTELVHASSQLRHSNRMLVDSILQTVLEMRKSCELLAQTAALSREASTSPPSR
jgi:hypothetical protein